MTRMTSATPKKTHKTMNLRKHFLLPACTLLSSVVAMSAPQMPSMPHPVGESDSLPLACSAPAFLEKGDTIAIISPSYITPAENVEKSVELLRDWGFVPIVGAHVGRTFAGKYAGTDDERLADLRWALQEPSVKAILCSRGGYGTLRFIDRLAPEEIIAHPKWMIGFSDITTLHGMWNCTGIMSIHGPMCSTLAKRGEEPSSILLRDMLMGDLPQYTLPAHPLNRPGRSRGTLVGGNLCTFSPTIGTWADATGHDDIILFVEEVGESFHNIDRLFNVLRLNGVLSRCRGVILGEFTDCSADLDYANVETMLMSYLTPYNIPVICGFPGGHERVNLPLVMGCRVEMEVDEKGARLSFDLPARQHEVSTGELKIEN